MKNRMPRKQKNNAGMSFITVIVALTLATIAATALIPNYVRLGVDKQKKTKDWMNKINRGIQYYYEDNGRYPNTDASEVDDDRLDVLYQRQGPKATWKGPYVTTSVTSPPGTTNPDDWILCDMWKQTYVITPGINPPATDTFTIRSRGRDTIQGTSDDMTITQTDNAWKLEVTKSELTAIKAALIAYAKLRVQRIPPLGTGDPTKYPPLNDPSLTSWNNVHNLLTRYNPAADRIALLLANPQTTGTPYLTDGWGTTYRYVGTGPGSPYVYSCGPDKMDNGGSGDDIREP